MCIRDSLSRKSSQERRLAGAVTSDRSQNRSIGEFDRQVLESDGVAEPNGH